MKFHAKEIDTIYEDEGDALINASAGYWDETPIGKFRCKLCGAEFDDDGDLFHHIGWGHGYVEEAPETEEEKERCKRLKTIHDDNSLTEEEKFNKIWETLLESDCSPD
jgi:uncharacterized C2H2 Zn-finger protein